MRFARTSLSWLVLLLPLLTFGAANGTAPSSRNLIPAVHILATDDRMVRLAAEGGYESVVLVLPWRDIEPTRDEWHWERSDFVARAAEYYGLRLILRLDHPPEWALTPAEDDGVSPIDLHAYAAFVETVARRYQGQVQGYIIWNEPNLSREWAGQSPDATAYTALLCRAYETLKAVEAGPMVISAGLAPTNGGEGAIDDRRFLREMYEAGGGACFDALGAHGYGFGHPPEDPRGAHDGLNLARLADLRDIMVDNGAADLAVWVTELGWTTDGLGSNVWQTVSTQQQADYLTQAWEYIGRSWPWVHLATVWNLSEGLSPTDEMAGYSLLQSDGSPKPAYQALADLFAQRSSSGPGIWAERVTASWRKPQPAEVPILAPDEIVHLGDDQ